MSAGRRHGKSQGYCKTRLTNRLLHGIRAGDQGVNSNEICLNPAAQMLIANRVPDHLASRRLVRLCLIRRHFPILSLRKELCLHRLEKPHQESVSKIFNLKSLLMFLINDSHFVVNLDIILPLSSFDFLEEHFGLRLWCKQVFACFRHGNGIASCSLLYSPSFE